MRSRKKTDRLLRVPAESLTQIAFLSVRDKRSVIITSDQGDLALAVVLRGHVDDLNRGRHYIIWVCGGERGRRR